MAAPMSREESERSPSRVPTMKESEGGPKGVSIFTSSTPVSSGIWYNTAAATDDADANPQTMHS